MQMVINKKFQIESKIIKPDDSEYNTNSPKSRMDSRQSASQSPSKLGYMKSAISKYDKSEKTVKESDRGASRFGNSRLGV